MRVVGLIVALLLFVILVVPFLMPIPPLKDTKPPEALADRDSRFADINGVRVHYKAGQGEPAREVKMRVIITGGTGLIGTAITASLAADGYEVIVLSRRPRNARSVPGRTRVEQWDGRSSAGWGRLADGAEAIINLAGENLSAGRWTEQRKKTIHQSRVDAGRAVVEAVGAAKNKPGVVIQASGIGHYGMHGDEIITEQAAAGNDFGASVTVDWEAASAPVEAMGVRRVIMRTAPVLSTKGGFLPKMMLPFRLFVGGKIGSDKQWLSWVHMADVVGAIRFMLVNRKAHGPYNLCAPNPVTNADFSRALARAMRRPSLMPVPAFTMRLIFGEMATVLLDGQRAVPERLLAMGFTFRFPDTDAALRDLLQ